MVGFCSAFEGMEVKDGDAQSQQHLSASGNRNSPHIHELYEPAVPECEPNVNGPHYFSEGNGESFTRTPLEDLPAVLGRHCGYRTQLENPAKMNGRSVL